MEQDEKIAAGESAQAEGRQSEGINATVIGPIEDVLPESVTGAEVSGAEETAATPGIKKEFRFARPIDELYDENQTDGQEEAEAETRSRGRRKGKKPKKRGRLLALLYAVLILAIAGVVAAFLLSAVIDFTAIGKPENKIDITIPQKASVRQIADQLKDSGVIYNNIAFRLYVKLKHESGFQYGTYTLKSDMSYGEIITLLKKPVTSRETVKVTIPEGKTIQQIDQILADKGVCSQGEFITDLEKGGFGPAFTFDALIPATQDRFYKYEGYLFPDTYEFYKDGTGKAAAKKFFANFQTKFDSTMVTRAQEIDMSVDQVLTLASIIQAETGDPNQMGKVSSVFHNRLEKGVAEQSGHKYLQSDATIYYATKDIQPVLQQASTEIASAYNTYKHEGLPPGPINNPGLAAIHAALYPDSTPYFYFVTDNNHKYYYAATYKEHTANVKKALQTNAAKGTDVFK